VAEIIRQADAHVAAGAADQAMLLVKAALKQGSDATLTAKLASLADASFARLSDKLVAYVDANDMHSAVSVVTSSEFTVLSGILSLPKSSVKASGKTVVAYRDTDGVNVCVAKSASDAASRKGVIFSQDGYVMVTP
jgi:hypothetical protein